MTDYDLPCVRTNASHEPPAVTVRLHCDCPRCATRAADTVPDGTAFWCEVAQRHYQRQGRVFVAVTAGDVDETVRALCPWK